MDEVLLARIRDRCECIVLAYPEELACERDPYGRGRLDVAREVLDCFLPIEQSGHGLQLRRASDLPGFELAPTTAP